MQVGLRRQKHLSGAISSTLWALILVGIIFFATFVWRGCQGLPSNVANCAITPTPPANTSVLPPAIEPPPKALCAFPLAISVPVQGGTVNSPANVVAQATPPDQVYWMRLYVDGSAVYYSFTTSINQFIWMTPGPHTIEVVAQDIAGYIATSTVNVTVANELPGISNIQNLAGWQSCSAALLNGYACASGLGTATSRLIQDQPSPSLSGNSAEFTLSGPKAYSNELYWFPLGGGSSVSHFTYDLWFYVDDGNAPQSLEFDVNQAFGSTRWTFGTQCDFNQSGKWNVWDPLHEVWQVTSVPCVHFPSQTWIHLVWDFERVGNQVHYIDLSVANNNYTVDAYYTAQPNWYQEEIDVAFQLDGNYKQQPYNVWLDNVTLDAY
jgi:hypothetical protein